jgi:hypothetical protein
MKAKRFVLVAFFVMVMVAMAAHAANKIPGQSTSAGPAAASFKNKLYCVYKANDPKTNAIWVTSTSDGEKWTGYKIPGQSTSAGLAAASFKDKLYCVYKANDRSNAIWVTFTSDGANWK